MFTSKEFRLNQHALPKSLYSNEPYLADSSGLNITQPEMIEEIKVFLQKFLDFLHISSPGIFIRIDAFPTNEGLQIIELNGRFVDGWGTALNLCRLTQIPIQKSNLLFPELWHLPKNNRNYQKEFDLARQELHLLGVETKVVGEGKLSNSTPTYYYGWDYKARNNLTKVYPAFGFEIDDKLNLAQFSWHWKGKFVHTPTSYFSSQIPWDDVPKENTIFKFREKHSIECTRAHGSTFMSRNVRNWDFIRTNYESEVLIAQDVVEPIHFGKKICQIEILACGINPIAGYVLFADAKTKVINDACLHGPLEW